MNPQDNAAEVAENKGTPLLRFRGVDGEISDHGAHGLVETIRNNPDLKVLDFDGVKMSDRALAVIVDAVADHPNLYKFKLNDCYTITDDGIQALAKALERNQSLRILDLTASGPLPKPGKQGDQGFGCATMNALGDMLKVNHNIAVLRMGPLYKTRSNDDLMQVAGMLADSALADVQMPIITVNGSFSEDVEELFNARIENGQNRNFIRFYPPKIVFEQQIDETLGALYEAAVKLRAGQPCEELSVSEQHNILARTSGLEALLLAQITGPNLEGKSETPVKIEMTEALMEGVKDFAAGLPEIDPTAIEGSVALFNNGGDPKSMINNPKTWEKMPEILAALEAKGEYADASSWAELNAAGESHLKVSLDCGQFGAVLNHLNHQGVNLNDPALFVVSDGQATDLLKGLIATRQVASLFQEENWQFQTDPKKASALLNALPKDAQEQVNNLHALNARIRRQLIPEAELGRD